MYLFNKPGFCWDGETDNQKYRMCITGIIPSFEVNTNLKFDSVYVYTQQFYARADSATAQIYMSKYYPLILRQVRTANGQVIETEVLTSFTKK